MAFVKGVSGNPLGRKKVLDENKPTNKSLRSKAFMQLLRKFAPHTTQAVQVAVKVMNSSVSSEAGKLKASALIIGTYRDLLKEAYDRNYDLDDASPIQEDNKPQLFSLHMLKPDKPVEQ